MSAIPPSTVLTVLSLVKEVCGNPFLSKYHHQGDNFPEKSGSHSRFFVRIKNEGTGIHEHINQGSCMHLLLRLIKKKIVFF